MNKVKVFLTVDTEVWDFYDDIQKNIASSLWGETNSGDYGLMYLLELFERWDIKANFFVEPLFSLEGYNIELKKVVEAIAKFKQDIQLHIHTERLSLQNSELPLQARGNLYNYSLVEQEKIIAKGLSILRSYGCDNINAFRAGNYGGNIDTLRALKRNGIDYDTTYNACYLDKPCHMRELGDALLQPKTFGEVTIYPVTFFTQANGQKRHMQIVACSISEFIDALNDAYSKQIGEVVIVLHSFEAIQRKVGKTRHHQPDQIVMKRLEKLSQFLSENDDRFQTALFSEQIKKPHKSKMATETSLKVRNSSTFFRFIEQAIRKIR